MSTLTTHIGPVATSKPAVQAQIQYVIVNFTDGEDYAQARLNFVDEDGRINVAYDVNFTADELADWGNDDQILLAKALAKFEAKAIA